ncbi:hypothetical protein CRN41_21655 [Vibrio vulnificus]|nr:hypothetical protein CRN41_21655 [Vibrio vulnificus]
MKLDFKGLVAWFECNELEPKYYFLLHRLPPFDFFHPLVAAFFTFFLSDALSDLKPNGAATLIICKVNG